MLYKINLFYNNNSFDLFFECPEWKKYIKLVVFNKKFLKFFAKLPRPKYIPCVVIIKYNLKHLSPSHANIEM